ncbi:MAG: hypothetical protein ACOYUZ_03895 [Patescibacteria group bacterium]
MNQKKSVALLGTMATKWREEAKKHLEVCEVLDNTDPRWEQAKTAEQMELLLAQDIEMMDKAALVIWHHDADTAGPTARIELGFLAAFAFIEAKQTIVHVEPGVASREYMRALVLNLPDMHWAESWEEVYGLVPGLLFD